MLKPFGLLLIFVIGLAACGDDSGSRDQFPVSTGLPPGQQLSSLSRDQAVQLCKGVLDSSIRFIESDENIEYSCTLAGILLSLNVKINSSDGLHVDAVSCEKFREECIAMPPPTEVDGPDCEASAPTMIPSAACNANVGEYEMCIGELLAAVSSERRPVSCDIPAEDLLHGLPGTATLSAAQIPGCEQLARNCPELPWPSTTNALGRANQSLGVF